ncbi:hypothetical protein D3C85_128190 [compost metagenome]
MYHIGMKSSAQLIALINETNSLTLTLDDVQFGAPSVIPVEEQAEMENPANTRIQLIAKPNRYPIGEVTVEYDRIDLADFETLGDPSGIEVDTPLTPAKLMEAFNKFYGSALELIDIDTSIVYPEFDDEAVVELKASTTSLAYRGSIELLVESTGIDLATAISNKVLSGLVLKFAAPPA